MTTITYITALIKTSSYTQFYCIEVSELTNGHNHFCCSFIQDYDWLSMIEPFDTKCLHHIF